MDTSPRYEVGVDPADRAGTGRDAPDEPRPRRRLRTTIVAAVVVVVAAVWGFAIWYSVTRTGPEPLDAAVVDELRARCETSAAALAALDPVDVSSPPEARAARVRAENEILAAMVASGPDLRTADAEGQTALDAWIADWNALLSARADFAEALDGDDPRRLVVPSDGARPITVRMDEYARYHDLEACSPLELRAETVDGDRNYPA